MRQRIQYICLAIACLMVSACSPENKPDNTPLPETPGPAPQQHLGPPKKPTVLWAKPGFAPLFISQKPNNGEGSGDLIFQTLQTLLPQFKHVNTRANYTRIIAEMQKGSDICALLFYKKSREAYAIYSNPLAIIPSYQVYASLEGKAELDKAFGRDLKQTTLDELLAKSQSLTLLVTPHQSYGKKRDAILAKHKDSLNIQLHLTGLPAMMKKLATNRAQLMLAMPWVFHYEQDNLELHGRTAKIDLTDVPGYQTSYLTCTKNERGKQIIDTINAIKPDAHTVLRKAVAEWLLPEELDDYYQAYNDYFSTQKPRHR